MKLDIKKHLRNNNLYECQADIEIKKDGFQISIRKEELITNATIDPLVEYLLDDPNLFKKLDYSRGKYFYNLFVNRGIIIPSYNENKIIYYSGVRIRVNDVDMNELFATKKDALHALEQWRKRNQ